MAPLPDLPKVPTHKIGKTVYAPGRVSNVRIQTLEKRLEALQKSNLKPAQKGACTRMGTKLAELIIASNELGKKAQAIEKQIDELAVRIEKEGDICFSQKPKKK